MEVQLFMMEEKHQNLKFMKAVIIRRARGVLLMITMIRLMLEPMTMDDMEVIIILIKFMGILLGLIGLRKKKNEDVKRGLEGLGKV